MKIGCCGFPCAKSIYYQTFKVVELQNTFYTLPKLALLAKWRKEAPNDFEFVIKAPQFITHSVSSPTYRRANIEIKNPEDYGFFNPTSAVFEIWDTVLKQAEILQAKVILFQTPASFEPVADNIKNMVTFFNQIDRQSLILVWEPRGAWQPALIKKICSQLKLIDCVDPFLRKSSYGSPFYFRLHGGKGYRKKYTDLELKKVAEQINNRIGYVMFNNIHMLDDAKRLMELINGIKFFRKTY